MAAILRDARPYHGAYEAFPDGPEEFRPDGVDAALKRLFQAAVAHAQSRLDWYDKKAGNKGKVARGLRGWALCLFAMGTLAPILLTLLYKLAQAFGTGKADEAGFVDTIAKIPLAEIGFVSLGFAGALVIFDQFFDTSGSWIRFRQAQARLEVLLADLRFAWAGLLASSGGTFSDRSTVAGAVKLLRDFVVQVEQLAETETKEWADRFRSRISAFDNNSNLKTRLEAQDEKHGNPPLTDKSDASAKGDGAGKGKDAPAAPVTSIVRVVIEKVQDLDRDSLHVEVDSIERDVPDDGVLMLAMEFGKQHRLIATATRAGAPVHGELNIRPAVGDESRSFSLTLAP
jgi:SMODS and SLOG-associating 2TM effector domain 2